MTCLIVKRAFVALALGAALLQPASAQPAGYGRVPVKIRCGILLLESTSNQPGWNRGTPTNTDPYVFFNLDRRKDMKPPGWEFTNPLASGTVTPQIKTRWDLIMGAANPYQVGDKLTKNMAAYWEVDLSQISDKAITNYDVFMVHASGRIYLTPSDREKLRNFIDSGGTLWFDKTSAQNVEALNGFPIPFRTTNAGVSPVVNQPTHPILSYPYQINYFEAMFMGAHNGRHAIQRETLANIGMNGYGDVVATMEPDFDRMNVIVSNSAGAVVGVAPLGMGYMVITSGNITTPINEPAGGTDIGLGGNSGPFGGENFQNIPTLELKFVYNMIALSGGHHALSKGGRRLNSTFDDIGAPLLQAWSDQALDNDQGNLTNYVPPAIYKGLVFVTSQGRLYAYKADINRDLDGDGWNDDGIQDASIGRGFDLVWVSQAMTAPLSSPAAAEVTNATVKDQVFLVDGSGVLRVFNAFPKQNGRLQGLTNAAPIVSLTAPGNPPVINLGQENRGPYPPTFMEGVIYVTDAYQGNFGQINGRVWAVDAAAGQIINTGNPWSASGTGSPNLAEPSGPATVGYIPKAVGGGMDKVLYVSNRSTISGAANGVSSIWAGAKGESPPTVNRSATQIDVITEAAAKGLRVVVNNSSLGVHVYLIDNAANGAPLDPATMASYLDGTITQFAPGQLRLGLNQPLPLNIGVRIDYHIDWGTGAPNLIAQLIRGQVFMPDDVNRERYVVKSMALAPNGNLFVVTSNEFNNGTLFAFNEFQRGNFRLVYRWDLHDGFRVVLNGTQTVNVQPALVDQDYLVTNLFTFLNRPVRRLHFHGSPTIYNNVAYLTVSGDKATQLFTQRVVFVLAFDAAPTRTDIRLGGPVPAAFRLRQPDIAASAVKAQPERFVNLQADQADIQTDAGVIRFNNMMSSVIGDMRNGFSSSMPVIFSGNGVPEQLLDPNATGSKWSPLLWYIALNGYYNDGPALVMGNTIYLATGNTWAGLLQNPPRFESRAALFAMDAEIPPNDESIITIPGQPGLKQVRWLMPSGGPAGFKANPHIRWPSGEGATSFNDFMIRLNSTLLDTGIEALGVIGGDGTVVAWAETGLYAFKRANTVVADEGRVIETDSAGFVQWSSDLSYEVARNGNRTLLQTQKLVRPTKVYKTADNEYIVADTGADRIFRFDKGGGEIRTIERLSLDPTFRPDGWNEGEVLELRQPRDVAVWGDFVPLANNPFSVNRQPLEYWVHYLIADNGNRRLIELVDRYVADASTFIIGDVIRDAAGEAQLNKLVWHTPQNLSGRNWQYTGISRFQVGIDTNGNAQFVYIAAIGDTMPTRVGMGLDAPTGVNPRESGGGAGGIVIFDSVSGAGNRVINEVNVNGVLKKLISLNTVAVTPIGINGNQIQYAIMFTDATGVYEIFESQPNVWSVRWMLPNATYEIIRGVKLRAAAAKRLPNGQVLITNTFFGKDVLGRDFTGDVTQWAGNTFDFGAVNYGFTTNSIKFELPPVVGSRNLRNPQFADRL